MPYIHLRVLKWQVVGFDVSEGNLTRFAEAGGRLAESLPQALLGQPGQEVLRFRRALKP